MRRVSECVDWTGDEPKILRGRMKMRLELRGSGRIPHHAQYVT
jgi:hypothetical protein